MKDSKFLLVELEKYADQMLVSHEIFQYDPFDCIELAGGIVEEAWQNHIYEWFGGLEILIPLLLLNKSGSTRQPTIEIVAKALDLAQDYYHLRDYFYYTYNLPNAISWNFNSENQVKIEINDKSLPLQLFLELNNSFLGSKELYSDYELGKKIESLDNEVDDEFSPSQQVFQAYDICVKEAEIKLAHDFYYSFLPDDLVFDSYSIGQFYKVYTHIAARARLRRYFLEKRVRKRLSSFPNYIRPSKNDFVESLMEATNLGRSVVVEVLNDMTLDEFKIAKNQSISSFPLIFNLKDDFYYLFPNIICFSNCFNSLRKLWALKDPAKYGEKIAPHVNANFVRYVSKLLTDSGFSYVMSDIELKRDFVDLSDIDILAFCREHGFGYVVLACELKSVIPETFGKDYVSSVGPKGYLTKALSQVRKIHGFLDGKEFLKLVKKTLPKELFEYGLYGLIFLVITSHNIGVFVATDEAKVIDHQTLRYVLRSSRGDILHLLKLLDKKEFGQVCSQCYKILRKEAQFGRFQISIPMVGLTKLLLL